jgi:hypothetical protein
VSPVHGKNIPDAKQYHDQSNADEQAPDILVEFQAWPEACQQRDNPGQNKNSHIG